MFLQCGADNLAILTHCLPLFLDFTQEQQTLISIFAAQIKTNWNLNLRLFQSLASSTINLYLSN